MPTQLEFWKINFYAILLVRTVHRRTIYNMARTRASVAAKVVLNGKSSKRSCSAAPASSRPTASGSSGEKSSRSYSGGNSVCPRETPKWQKPITNFFIQNRTEVRADDAEDTAKAGSSKSKLKRNIIESDDEEPTDNTDKPINKELDETIELEPLTGENSHKIDEYYSTGKVNGTKRVLDESDEELNAGSSKSKPKRTVIHSDDEDEHTDTQTNKDQAIKDIDKEEKCDIEIDKENVDTNVNRNKRSLDESGDDRSGKKIKLD
ncbi:uncharacterized protein LOC112047772 isoform X2 [Bicyclus anynana]|nr:uncharacterized protein LOC112047772 isoform X2 [Bicyclus anynana]